MTTFPKVEMGKDHKIILVRELLDLIGDDPTRTGLKDTPCRVVEMWNEIYRSYKVKPPKIKRFPNDTDGIHYDQLIVDSGNFFSTCEHHMIPFFGEYCFAYIPDKYVIGISKIARVVDHFAAKLQVQERLNKEIVDYIADSLKPRAIGLVMRAKHLCRIMRGVKKDGYMITSDLRGELLSDPSMRAEFMGMLKWRD